MSAEGHLEDAREIPGIAGANRGERQPARERVMLHAWGAPFQGRNAPGNEYGRISAEHDINDREQALLGLARFIRSERPEWLSRKRGASNSTHLG
jgi:hypothetical protein